MSHPCREHARWGRGEGELEKQRLAAKGASLAPKAAGFPPPPAPPPAPHAHPGPARANRIQKVIQSPGSEFLEDPGWGRRRAGRRPGGREGSDQNQVPSALPFHPGLPPEAWPQRRFTDVSNWLPGERWFNPESQEWESNQTQV